MSLQTLFSNQFVISLIAILLTIDKVVSNGLQLDQIVNLKNSGGIGCVLAVHTEVEKCKTVYTQRVTEVVEKGHPMTSPEYRRQYCCGFWSLRDCVADSARHKCDSKSAKTIANMRIYSSEQENVLQKNCDGFEYGSKQCASASSLSTSLSTIISAIIISYLIRR